MSSCPNDEERVRAFVAVHVLTHPLCIVVELALFLFTFKHVLKLWQIGRISRGSMTFALGYFSASMANQIDGLIAWVLTPALNLSRRTGAGHCQTQAFFGWVSPAFSYLFLVLFWVERLRQTFKYSTFEVSDKTIALIRGFWFTIIVIELVLGTAAAVETRCSAPSKVMDYNLFSMKTPHYCATTKRGHLFRALYSGFGAVMILGIQVTLGYMYVSRLKTVFIDSGKPERGTKSSRVDSGRLSQRVLKSGKALTLVKVNSASVASDLSRMTSVSLTDVSKADTSKRKQKRKPKLRKTMAQKELDYFRKSAIIALTSCVSTFVAAILVAFARIYFLLFWDLLLNALLIASSFEFGSGIYDRLFCCCQRVFVATVDRATSISAAKNTPVTKPTSL